MTRRRRRSPRACGANIGLREKPPHSPRRDLDEGVSVEMVCRYPRRAYLSSRLRYPFPGDSLARARAHVRVRQRSGGMSIRDGESIGLRGGCVAAACERCKTATKPRVRHAGRLRGGSSGAFRESRRRPFATVSPVLSLSLVVSRLICDRFAPIRA